MVMFKRRRVLYSVQVEGMRMKDCGLGLRIADPFAINFLSIRSIA